MASKQKELFTDQEWEALTPEIVADWRDKARKYEDQKTALKNCREIMARVLELKDDLEAIK